MNILKTLSLFNKKTKINNGLSQESLDQYLEIAKIVQKARIKKNLTVQELSLISKIPEQTINSIENNNKNIRPKYPFIRSILIKLEECLELKKDSLIVLVISERKNFKNEKKEYLVSKFDVINTWLGVLLYFFILVLTIFILKRYFVLEVNVIEIQNTENKIINE